MRAYSQVLVVGVLSRARKVLVAAQARAKGGNGAMPTKGHRRGLHAKASLTFAALNPSCEETSSCSFSHGSEETNYIVSNFRKEKI